MNENQKQVQALVEESMLAKLEYYYREPDSTPADHHNAVIDLLVTTLRELRLRKKIQPFVLGSSGGYLVTQNCRSVHCYIDQHGMKLKYYNYWFQVDENFYHSILHVPDHFYKENNPELLTHLEQQPVVGD